MSEIEFVAGLAQYNSKDYNRQDTSQITYVDYLQDNSPIELFRLVIDNIISYVNWKIKKKQKTLTRLNELNSLSTKVNSNQCKSYIVKGAVKLNIYTRNTYLYM